MTTDTDQPDFFSMRAQLLEVKDEFGSEEAKRIIKTVGLVERMADIKPERVNEVIAACRAKLNPPSEEVDPLDVVDEKPVIEQTLEVQPGAPKALSDYGLRIAIESIEAIPDERRTTESALRAVWATWQVNIEMN